MILRRLYDIWLLFTAKQYFLVVDDDEKIICAGINDDRIREADKWFMRVSRALRQTRKEFRDDM